MVEGIPSFFVAGKYGIGLIVLMALVFAISTIATYVLLCVHSTAGLQRVRLGAFERYGEVLSGAFIAIVGLAFWIGPFSNAPDRRAALPRVYRYDGKRVFILHVIRDPAR